MEEFFIFFAFSLIVAWVCYMIYVADCLADMLENQKKQLKLNKKILEELKKL